MALIERLQRQIHQAGPLSVAHFMTLCLLDPVDGYYPTKDPIGAGADFITAPEVSQMFGELIGIWLIHVWEQLGKPQRLNLVEFGPGKGTMMSDVLRTARSVPAFSSALNVHLIEASAALVAVQAQTLGPFEQPMNWCDHLRETADGPLVVLANEYLDCLPVRQFVRQKDTWFERLVDCTPAGELQYVLANAPLSPLDIEQIPAGLRAAEPDSLIELRPGMDELFAALKDRAKADPVIGLLIDYGPASSECGDTLQAVFCHKKVDPLLRPGQVDLTARVDFASVSELAKTHGFTVTGPLEQGKWLQQMGIMQRAAALMSNGQAKKSVIARQVHRLTDADEMGNLFKVLAISSDKTHKLAGFG
ncbi:SAM-dependent methyltransferase, MidA [hydrothermal vent metagenome]|uniref:SAM-dependent methyltransferase, MidA n=1 Tax=hydrothermal vent metagenome TaxID=652676 RepID=A0A3B0RDH7_9ZZZZ